MTRAKRAMYVIAEPVGKSTSRNFPKLLEQTLRETWSSGERSWYAPLAPEKTLEQGTAELAPLPETAHAGRPRLPSRRPSDAKARGAFVTLFGAPGSGAADFGTRVHELFETVEWWDPAQEAAWVSARKKEGVDDAALAEALGCLTDPAMAAVFCRPPGRAEVWRERSFEVVMDEIWLTGVFDRVVIERDAAGCAVGAWVIDFKTDRLGAGDEAAGFAEDKHAGQLNLYRRVAATLTGLTANQVKCVLVMTARKLLVEVRTRA
jgi:ATP-dependent helicase/nuclease subunit A